jgi:hypothetical protein
MLWMNRSSVVLRYDCSLREKKRRKFCFGTDNIPGSVINEHVADFHHFL